LIKGKKSATIEKNKSSKGLSKEPVKDTGSKDEIDTYKRFLVRNRSKIKTQLSQASIFRFIFREYKKIRSFGEESHVLYSNVLPSSISLNKDIGKSFGKHLQPTARELVKVLDRILKNGWFYLFKTEYNLLVVLKALCERIVSINFGILNYKDRNLIVRLASLENPFLVLHYEPEYPDTIINTLKKALVKDSGLKEAHPEVVDLGKRVLMQDATLPSLYNFILGLNMFKYRRYFELKDLISGRGKRVISSTEFDCASDVRHHINRTVREYSSSLVPFHKEKLEIMRLKSFLPVNSSGEFVFSSLQRLYETGRTEKKYSYSNDKNNVMLFTSRFLERFDHNFTDLLTGEIQVQGAGKVKIFTRNFFGVEISRIQYLIDKFEKLSFDFSSSFTWKRFIKINRDNMGASRIEAEVMLLLHECLGILHEIGIKLSKVLRMKQPGDSTAMEHVPVDTDMLSGRVFNVPFENSKVKSKTEVNGKTVAEAFSFVITICFLACVFYQDRYTISLLEREKSVDDEINLKLSMLERIADNEMYSQLKKKFFM
jgi:hypothetical protein